MIRCPNCNREHPNSVVTCDCGFDLQTYTQQLQVKQKEREAVSRPFQMLPILLIALRVIGVLAIVSGAVYAVMAYSKEESIWSSLGIVIVGIFACIPYFALSEALTILLQMSEKQGEILQIIKSREEIK